MQNEIPAFIHEVSNIYRKFQIFLAEELQPFGLHPSSFPILMVLLYYKGEGVLQDDFTKKLGMTKSVVTRVLKQLEDDNYVYRTESKHSKRHKLIFPHKKALVLAKKLDKITTKWNNIILHSMQEADIKKLSELLYIPYKNTLDYYTHTSHD